MANIPSEVIDEIRNKARIEEVIGHYISVIKQGSSYKAVCPFHDDHDPSLSISTEKQIYKCFVCGNSGNVFGFVQNFEKVDFPTAVKKVAGLIGYDKYNFDQTSYVNRFVETSLHKAVKDSVLFCQNELNSASGQSAKKYLQKRKISQASIDKFEIGYNPAGNRLYSFLSQRGYSDMDIVSANLARTTERGMMDVFHDRIMIPIHDSYGHPIGFTARTINPNVDSKYINTNETPLFRKSLVVFNLHRAYEAIKKNKRVILAEGAMDVIAFDSAGLEYAVCSMGTSCTKEQLTALRRITDHLIMGFDGDEAGQKAIYSVGTMARSLQFRVDVIDNRTDMDPDEIINSQGAEKLREMVEKPRTWIEFVFGYLKPKYDLENYSSRKEFASRLMNEINQLSDSFDRDNYISELARMTGFTVELLKDNFQSAQPKTPVSVLRKPPVREKQGSDGVEIAEMTILKQMMLSYRMCLSYRENLGYLKNPEANILAMHIVDYYKDHETFDRADFRSKITDEKQLALLEKMEKTDLIGDSIDEKWFSDAMVKIKLSSYDDLIAEERAKMNNYTDEDVIARILTRITQLKKEKDALRKGEKNGKE